MVNTIARTTSAIIAIDVSFMLDFAQSGNILVVTFVQAGLCVNRLVLSPRCVLE